GVSSDWTRIQNAKTGVKAVIADSSFPTLTGTGLGNAQAQFDSNRTVGQLVLGYVDTAFGSRPLSEVLGTSVPSGAPACADSSDCSSPNFCYAGICRPTNVADWYAQYSTHIDGIFFDD